MSITVNDKNIGHATAYAYYKAGGGTMTEAEFTEFMADFGTASQTAVTAAQTATTKASEAATSATTATNKASEATTAAQTATSKAAEASTSASTATSAKDTAVGASQTATTKAGEATTAAATATSAATTATTAKDDAVSAKTAAQTAKTGAETAAASVSSSAAQIATNTQDITALKSEISEYSYTLSWNDGGYVNATGGIAQNNSSKYTDYIDLKINGLIPPYIFFKKKTTRQWVIYAFYNDTTFITGSYGHTEDNYEKIIVPSNATHIRFSAANVEYSYVSMSSNGVAINSSEILTVEKDINSKIGEIEAYQYDVTWNANGYVSNGNIVENANNHYTDLFSLAIDGIVPAKIKFVRPVLTNWVNYAFFSDSAYISWGYITEESSAFVEVPNGATRMRFSTSNSTYLETYAEYTKGNISEQLNDLDDRVTALESESGVESGSIKLTLNNNDVSFTSDFYGHEMHLTAQKSNTRVDSNPIFNFLYYYLDGSTFKRADDDITPIQINQPNMSSTYIGGGHGFSNGLKLTTNNTKTESDIGSVWEDANGIEFVIYNVGTGYVKVVNPTVKTITSPLTHKSGATDTTQIVFSASEMAFIIPAINGHSLQFIDSNGKDVSGNGTYYSKYFDVVESYNIIDPVAVIDYLKENVGNCTNESVVDSSIQNLCKVNIVYRITKGCACTVYQSVDSIQNIIYSYAGLIQCMSIGEYAYVPDAFSNEIQHLSGTTLSIDKVNGWNSQTKVPYRYYEFNNSNYEKGFFVGYYPKIGLADNTKRLGKCTGAGFYYGTTKKIYPHLINRVQINSGETVEAVCFRTPILKRTDGSLAVTFNYVGNDVVVCIDYQSAFDGFVDLIDDCVGKQIEVVDKTSNCTMSRAIASSTKLPIAFAGKGYAVLRFY